MKKLLLIASIVALFTIALTAQPVPARYLYQQLLLDSGDILGYVTAASPAHTTDFYFSVYNNALDETVDTNTVGATNMRVCVQGGMAFAIINQSVFSAAWPTGSILTLTLTYTPTAETATHDVTVPAGTATITMFGANAWVLPWGNAHITGSVVSIHDLTGLDFTAPGALNITVTIPDYDIEVPDGWSGTVTPVLAGYTFVPAFFEYTNVTTDIGAQNYQMVGDVAPDAPIIVSPLDGTVFDTWAAPQTVDLEWGPPVAGYLPVEGYKLNWNNEGWVDMLMETTWTTPPLDTGAYTWSVLAYINTPRGKGYVPVKSKISNPAALPKGDGAVATAAFEVIIGIPEIEIPGSPPTGVTIVEGGTINVLPGYDTGLPAVAYTITATGTWNITIHRPAGYPTQWHIYLLVGAILNHEVTDEESYTFFGVNFDFKGDVITIIDDNDSLTLPVELSSFTAVLTGNFFVKLTWVSQSETGLLGYKVYRNETNDLSTAVSITPVMIPATNTSTMQTYSITDTEVYVGSTYWYWLESVDFGHSQFHGPVSILVEGEVPPVLPTQNALGNAYPNPFKASTRTTIDVNIKEGETGQVTIYNILGQAVQTFTKGAGYHKIVWDGKDSRGNACGSGIYFYKLSSPSLNQTKKMVIVK